MLAWKCELEVLKIKLLCEYIMLYRVSIKICNVRSILFISVLIYFWIKMYLLPAFFLSLNGWLMENFLGISVRQCTKTMIHYILTVFFVFLIVHTQHINIKRNTRSVMFVHDASESTISSWAYLCRYAQLEIVFSSSKPLVKWG